MKRIILFFILSFLLDFGFAQTQNRIIFIGNVGEYASPRALMDTLSRKVLPGKTIVFFTGDFSPNLHGINPNSNSDINTYKAYLEKITQPLTKAGAKVRFIPGPREWDNKGNRGLQRLLELNKIVSQTGPAIAILPQNGCPGPISLRISKHTTLIVLDTQWWLHPFQKNSNSCPEITKDQVENKLRKMAYQNRDKNILLITSHSFLDLGKQAGNFSWKDHLFPLTNLNKNLYLPLPGIGSLYPLTKKIFPGRQSLRHPEYMEMIRRTSAPFKGIPNRFHLSSSENDLQYLEDPKAIFPEIITGVGHKNRYQHKNNSAIFSQKKPGFVLVDENKTGELNFSFYYIFSNQEIEKVYSFTHQFQQLKNTESKIYTPIKRDSIHAEAFKGFSEKGKFTRLLLGNKYRKVWAQPVKLPVLHLSSIQGGLKYRKMGGGHQTINMRLKDSSGNQYVLRGVKKTPDRVIPYQFETPFTRDLVDNMYSSQHPYGALVVPPIANAVKVPHANPVIGVVSPDTALAHNAYRIAGKVFLLEAWEPVQPTDNYRKALKKIRKDNQNRFDGINFLKARMLDLLLGDWDRDEDQWRFSYIKKGKHKYYTLVPRDRDMVFNATEGLAIGPAKRHALTPHVNGFKADLLQEVNWYLYNSDFLNAEPEMQINKEKWDQIVREFQKEITDSVLKTAIHRLPKGLNSIQNQKIYKTLKKRRTQLPQAMDKYYKFINHIVDIRGSNRKELVEIKGVPGKDALHIQMHRIDKHGKIREKLMDKIYPHQLTKEIRIYLEKDFDSVVVDNSSSSINLRIIGGKPRKGSHKAYNILNSRNKIKVYDYQPEHYYGKTHRLIKKISSKENNTAFAQVRRYPGESTMHPSNMGKGNPTHGLTPAISNVEYNRDDGLKFGFGLEWDQFANFRKKYRVAHHKILFKHATNTGATAYQYIGDWNNVMGKANLLVKAVIKNHEKRNFFGWGNEAPFKSAGQSYKYFKTTFDRYQIQVGLRWNWHNHTLIAGPLFEHYYYRNHHNKNHFTEEIQGELNPTAKAISASKSYLGVHINYDWNRKDNPLLPTRGTRLKARLTAYSGLNSASHATLQFASSAAFYKALNPQESLILSDRLGGEILGGNPAFYQYAYLGGQGNLLGYRQYRFSGKAMAYNNLEIRAVLSDFGNHYFKGQLGLTGFWDSGRTWLKHEHSHKLHHSLGAGIYLAPAYETVLHFTMAHSDEEGWFPYIQANLRF